MPGRTPVCTGCAVTERFAFRTKYFYDEENLERFRAEYDQMPIHQKALENKPLTAGVVGSALLGVIVLFVATGIV